MKSIDELLRNLRRPEVLEFALASERLPCVKVGASFQPVDGGAPSTDQVLEMLVASGGSRYVDALHESPTRWSFRLDGVGVIGISAVLRSGIVQARFTLTKREAPSSRHDSSTFVAAAPPRASAASPAAADNEERHPSDDDEPTMVSETGSTPSGSAPQAIVKESSPGPAAGSKAQAASNATSSAGLGLSVSAAAALAKPSRKDTPRGQAAARATAARTGAAPPPAAKLAAPPPAPPARPPAAPPGPPASPPKAAASASSAKPVAPPPPVGIGVRAHGITDDDEPPTRANDKAEMRPGSAAPKVASAPNATARNASTTSTTSGSATGAKSNKPSPEDEPQSSVEHARIFRPEKETGAEAGIVAAPSPPPTAGLQAQPQPTLQPAARAESPSPSPAPASAPAPAANAGPMNAATTKETTATTGATLSRPVQKGNSPAALRELLASARSLGASDLHVIAGRPPLMRTAGELLPSGDPIDAAEVEKMARAITPHRLQLTLDEDGSCDFAFDEDGIGRFRCNVSRQRTGYKLSLRLIPAGVPTLAQLGLPEAIGQATHHHQGLIVITGPTGHGKTTTLAALVNLINTESSKHVITVEDPVEYVHPRKRATMSQREVGTHTRTFAAALKASLRQDPDVVVVGELRDTETVRMALSASETGHLVLGTMNTPSAAKTIDRLIDLFPPADQAQVRATLAGGLRLIVSQRLVPSADRRSMVAVAELLPGSTALYTLIRDNKTFQIPSLQQRGRGAGMLRLDDSLADLVRSGKTSLEIARAAAESPDELDAQLKANPAAAAPGPGTATGTGTVTPAAPPHAAGAGSPPPNAHANASAGQAAKLGAPAPHPNAAGAAAVVKAPQGSLFQRAGSLFNNKKD